jgi:hypothetical protein
MKLLLLNLLSKKKTKTKKYRNKINKKMISNFFYLTFKLFIIRKYEKNNHSLLIIVNNFNNRQILYKNKTIR